MHSYANTDVIVDPISKAGSRRAIATYTGLYHLDELSRTKVIVANTSQQNIEIRRGEVLGVVMG